MISLYNKFIIFETVFQSCESRVSGVSNIANFIIPIEAQPNCINRRPLGRVVCTTHPKVYEAVSS